MQAKAARWFQPNAWFWKATSEKTVNTKSVITSWMIFNCTSVKGPPFPTKPIRLAGTMKEYSKRAIPPGKENDRVERPAADQLGALKFKVGVPGERHENVRDEKKTDGGKAFRKHDGGRAQTERL